MDAEFLLIVELCQSVLFLFSFFVQLNATNTISMHIEDNDAIPVSITQQIPQQ